MSMIFIECYGDEALMNYCGYSDVTHSFGSGNIGRKLENKNNSIALIDEDTGKTKQKYFDTLKQINEPKYSVRILKDFSRNNKVIMIEPDLEGWLFKVFEDTKSKDLLKKYGFKENKNGLHSDLSSPTIAKKFPLLLAEIEKHTKSPRLEALRIALKE